MSRKQTRRGIIKKRKKFRNRAVAVGTAAAISLGAGITLHKAWGAFPLDVHQLSVLGDSDGDLLADAEEATLAYLQFERDQNRNDILDGAELAQLCAADINDLPLEGDAEPGETYKVEHLVYGMETCDYCATEVNMGFLEVVNPTRALTVPCPFISLHYMEHGSFSYAGTVNDGRLDVPSLLDALELRLAYDPNDHQLPVRNDSDSDLLSNAEETAIGYRPFDSDQNRNETPDGVELAQRCADAVGELPPQHEARPGETYKIEHALDGVEACHVCGAMIHMGGWEIINPKLNFKYPDPNDPLDGTFLPDLALHYMEHGSFDCYGHVHSGRADIARLLWVLQMRHPNDPNDHQLPLDYAVEPGGQLAPDANDHDGDLLADTEELAAGSNPYDPDQDDDLVPDGIELAMQFADGIEALPVYDPGGSLPEPNEPYKIDYRLRGLELCEVCGESVNMGHEEVVNPNLGLRMDVYFVASHYMSHGSLSYSGLQIDEPHEPFHNGRIKIALLAQILEMPHLCGHLGTIYLPADFNKDCIENFKDFADFAEKWLQSTDPARDGHESPRITYNIAPCDPLPKSGPLSPPEPTFSVRVEGSHILFEDMIHANCCPERLEVHLFEEGNVIKLYEAEYYGEAACDCECDFPTDATLGPFEDGSYVLEVYRQMWDFSGELQSEEFKGFAEVTIGGG